MNNFFNRVLFQLKSAGKKIVVVGMLGLSLWSLAAPANAVPYQEGDRGIQSTELYDQIQEEKGGMNNFDAVDPRRDTTRADAKAQKLSDVATRRKAAAADPLEPVRDAVGDIKNNITSAADDAVDSAKEAARDAKSTAKDVKNTAQAVADDLADNAKDAARDVKKDLR